MSELQKRLKDFIGGRKEALDPNLFRICFASVLKTTTAHQNVFDSVFSIFKTNENLSARLAALESLGAVGDFEILTKFLYETVLDPEIVKNQDLADALSGLDSCHSGEISTRTKNLKLKWFFDNFQALCLRFPNMERIVRYVLNGQYSFETIELISAWQKTETDRIKKSSIERALLTGTETIALNTKWYLNNI